MKKLIYFFTFVFLSFLIVSVNAVDRRIVPIKSNFVSCHFQGQLGNQLFQIATTLAYAWDYGALPIFPELNRTDFHLCYNRDRLFFRLKAIDCPKQFVSNYFESGLHSTSRVPFKKDQLLHGYFQSWKHFHHHRDELIETFAPSQKDLDYLNYKYGALIALPNTVSVHVRTMSPETCRKTFPFLGMEYYRKTMDMFPDDTIFVMFSDRIEWCKKHFADFDKSIIFVDGNDSIQDLILMSMMKNHIIANSTFSWWAAYLNKNDDKIVIAPKYWYHPDHYVFTGSKIYDFYLPDWQIVEQNLDEPYPDDIGQFHTQSYEG